MASTVGVSSVLIFKLFIFSIHISVVESSFVVYSILVELTCGENGEREGACGFTTGGVVSITIVTSRTFWLFAKSVAVNKNL